MSTLTYTYTIANGQTSDATKLMQNFNDARAIINGSIGDANMSTSDPLASDKLQAGTGSGLDADTVDGVEASAIVSTYFPTGIICLWYGIIDNIPSGWYLCDGDNGTPDLVNMFVVGATTAAEVAAGNGEYEVGNTGGEKTHTLTEDEMPKHTHKANVGSGTVLSGGLHRSDVGTYLAGKIQNTGGDAPHENRPPYYALAYIMKG